MFGVHDHFIDPGTEEEGGGCRDRRKSISQYQGNLSKYFNSTQTTCISGGHLLACTPRLSLPQRFCPVLKQPGSKLSAEHQGLHPGFSCCCHCGTARHFSHMGLGQGIWEECGQRGKPTRGDAGATHPPAPQDHNQALFPLFLGLSIKPGLPNNAVFQLTFYFKVYKHHSVGLLTSQTFTKTTD